MTRPTMRAPKVASALRRASRSERASSGVAACGRGSVRARIMIQVSSCSRYSPWGPRHGPHTPTAPGRPGEAVAPLDLATCSRHADAGIEPDVEQVDDQIDQHYRGSEDE